MKLQVTLISALITLSCNTVYAVSDDAFACNKAYEHGDLDKAAALALKAVNVNKDDRDAYICQGRTFSAQGNLDSALAAFKSAETLSADAYDKAVVALVTGHAYKNAGKYEQAISSYQQSLAQATLAKSIAFQRQSHLGIGNVYFLTKQYTPALESYLAASNLDANDNERAEGFEKIALAYHVLNQHELAVENQVKAFIMQERSGTLDQYANSSIELGRYYAAAKDYISAEKTLNKIIKFAIDQGGPYYEAKGSYVLAQVKVATGDMEAAKTLIEKAMAIAKDTHDSALADEIAQETQGLIK